MLLATATVAAAACEKQDVKQRLYFDDPKPPVGVAAKIVTDDNLNPSEGGSVTMTVAVDAAIDRDDLDKLMRVFWDQVSARSGFRNGEADKVDIRYYVGEGKAKAGADDWIGRTQRTSRSGEPAVTNRQKLPLLKWAQQALGKQPQFTGELKPRILADADALEIEIKVPFVQSDGSGKYVEQLTYTRATTEFSSYTRTLFDKIEKLEKLAFIGMHDGREVMRIWLTREQYEQLNLRHVEEGLGAFQGKFISRMLEDPKSAKMVERKTAQQRRKVYRETFARLPKEQVQLDKSLR